MFTVITLKSVCRALGLLTTGNKQDIIRRLQNPIDAWMQQAEIMQNEGPGAQNNDEERFELGGVAEARDRELNFLRRSFHVIIQILLFRLFNNPHLIQI